MKTTVILLAFALSVASVTSTGTCVNDFYNGLALGQISDTSTFSTSSCYAQLNIAGAYV